MKKKAKLTLIVLLLIAVAAASFMILRISKAGAGPKQAELASEQTEQADPGEDDRGSAADELLATVFFASDYQAEEGFDAPADTLHAVLEAAKADVKSIDRAVICGDYTNDEYL